MLRLAHGPNGEVLRATCLAPGTLELELIDRHGIAHRGTVVRVGEGLVAFDADGRPVASVPHLKAEPSLAALAH